MSGLKPIIIFADMPKSFENAFFPFTFKGLVPHLQRSLRENAKFLQNFRSKNNTLKEKFWPIFSFNICHCILGLALRSKNYCFRPQNCVHFTKENCKTYVKNVSELCEKKHLGYLALSSTLFLLRAFLKRWSRYI